MHEFSNHKNKLDFVCFLLDNFEELVIFYSEGEEKKHDDIQKYAHHVFQ